MPLCLQSRAVFFDLSGKGHPWIRQDRVFQKQVASVTKKCPKTEPPGLFDMWELVRVDATFLGHV